MSDVDKVRNIPKTIHVIWIGPHDPPSECIATWETMHVNGWMFILWRDHTGWKNQAQIDRMREWNGKADIMRYEILAKHGGIAIDADSTCVKTLDEGPEDLLNVVEGAWACYESEAVRPGLIACGALGAEKGSKFFARCVEEIATADMSEPAWKTVGPGLITRVASAMPEALKVFPAKLFNPTHFSGVAAPGDCAPRAKQHWGSTKGYGALRKWPCQCSECRISALNPPWG